MTVLLLRMERNGTRMEQLKKKEREKNDLAEGPRSRMGRNDLKKVGTCPALGRRHGLSSLIYLGSKLNF